MIEAIENFIGFDLSASGALAVGSGIIIIVGLSVVSLVFFIFRKY